MDGASKWKDVTKSSHTVGNFQNNLLNAISR